MERGYPKLIEAGSALRQSGVAFHDLTNLFVEEHETIYKDYFCHYNKRGSNLLAEAVAARILESLAP